VNEAGKDAENSAEKTAAADLAAIFSFLEKYKDINIAAAKLPPGDSIC